MIKLYRLQDWWLNRKRRLARRAGEARGVLLISSGGLGDTVLFAHVIDRFVASAREDEPVVLLLRRDAMKMAFLMPPRVKVMGVDFDRLRDLAYRKQITDEIFDAHYRLVVHTDYLRHPDLDEALVAAAAAAEVAAMEPRPWPKYAGRLRRNRRLYGRLFDSGAERRDKVLRWCAFADWLTGEADRSPPPRLMLAPDRLAPAAQPAAPTVVIQPFSAVARKRSPPALYHTIIEALPAGTETVITGTVADLDADHAAGGGIAALLQRPRVRFDGGTFEDLVPLLRAARLVVSVDTALMHLAAGLGVPTLCLASAAYVGEIVPYDDAIRPANVRFVYHSMPCEGCLGDCVLAPENGMFPCVARLDEDEILGQMRSLILPTGKATP